MGSIDNAPGDFSAIDDEGEDIMLLSTGMFRLNIHDSMENELNLAGKIRIEIEAPIANTYSNGSISRTRLWRMKSENGKWEFLSDMRHAEDSRVTSKKNSNDWGKFYSELEGISVGEPWINFDYISEVTCHSKIRIFNREGIWNENQITGADVRVLILDNDYTGIDGDTVSEYRAITDRGDSNGYCLIHPCDTPRGDKHYGFKGYIVADNPDFIFKPDDDETRFPEELEYKLLGNTIEVNLDFTATPDNGPFYDWECCSFKGWQSSEACSDATMDEKHFRFYLNPLGECSSHGNNVKDNVVIGIEDESNLYAWNTGHGYMFVKVVINRGDNHTKVQAWSMVGEVNHNDIELTEGKEYGVREECPKNRTVCLEVKVSGGVSDGFRYFEAGNVLTKVDISLADVSYTRLNIQPKDYLINEYESDIETYRDGVYLTLRSVNSDKYGKMFGIYYHEEKREAKYACRRGTDDYSITNPPKMTADNAAFTFTLN